MKASALLTIMKKVAGAYQVKLLNAGQDLEIPRADGVNLNAAGCGLGTGASGQNP